MSRHILPFLLALLTVFVVGRIGLSFVHHASTAMTGQEGVNVEKRVRLQSAPQDAKGTIEGMAAGYKDTAQTHNALLWNGALIPSAEAAAAMSIAEEAEPQQGESQNVGSLRAAREQLDSREKAVKEKEITAKDAEDRASKRITELQELEARIQDLLEQEKSINDKKIKRLTAVYEGMKADKAAPQVAMMKLEIVVKMFSRMDEKKVGKILSFLPPKQAVVISQALTKRIGSLPR